MPHNVPRHFFQAERIARRHSDFERLDRERERASEKKPAPWWSTQYRAAPDAPVLKPLSFDQQSGNELRPRCFAEMIGQERIKGLLARIVTNVQRTGVPLDHMLLVGESGTGKTTTAIVVAQELRRRVFMLKAPVDYATFEAMTRSCQDGDIVLVDEIHLQSSGDRRGITQSADPETYFAAMEERRLITPTGVIAFPAVTFIGTTTDEGLLPLPFLNRFPLRPRLDPYTVEDMTRLAIANAHSLHLTITADAAAVFALAARKNPRQMNTYTRNARQLGALTIDTAVAQEVVHDLNGTTWDGLNIDMQNMLRVLLRSRREDRQGNVVYQASVNTIATQLGKSRDQKGVALYIEPWLIAEGLVAVGHGGRQLTDAGIERARALA